MKALDAHLAYDSLERSYQRTEFNSRGRFQSASEELTTRVENLFTETKALFKSSSSIQKRKKQCSLVAAHLQETHEAALSFADRFKEYETAKANEILEQLSLFEKQVSFVQHLHLLNGYLAEYANNVLGMLTNEQMLKSLAVVAHAQYLGVEAILEEIFSLPLSKLNRLLPPFFKTLKERGSFSCLFPFLRQFKNESVMQALIKYILQAPDIADHCNEIIQCAEQEEPWALHFLKTLLDNFTLQRLNQGRFLEHLASKMETSQTLQLLGFSLLSFYDSEDPVYHYLFPALNNHRLLNLPKDLSYYILCLSMHMDYLSKQIVRGRYVSSKFEDYPSEAQICAIYLQVKRDHTFIQRMLSLNEPNELSQDFELQSSFYPQTQELLLSHATRRDPLAGSAVLQAQAQFSLSHTYIAPEDSDETEEYHYHTSFGSCSTWVRDLCIVAADKKDRNTFLIPRMTGPKETNVGQISSAQHEKVRLRSKDPENFIPLEMSIGGRISFNGEQMGFLDHLIHSQSSLKNIQLCSSFFEGGNLKVGCDAQGSRYVIAGDYVHFTNSELLRKDCYRLGIARSPSGTFYLLEESLDKKSAPESAAPKLSLKEVKKMMAADLGVSSDHLYVVTQGRYHIDMCLSVGENKVVLLNDSSDALLLQQRRWEQLGIEPEDKYFEQLKAYTKKIKVYEDLMEEDLKKQGFQVKRFAGLLYSDSLLPSTEKDTFKPNYDVNFFNHISFAAPSHGDFKRSGVLALHIPEDLKDYFQSFLLNHYTDPPIDQKVEVVYCSEETSSDYAEAGAGATCATQTLFKPFISKAP